MRHPDAVAEADLSNMPTVGASWSKIFDIFFGVKLEAFVSERVHVYAAGGPLLLIGRVDDQRDDEDVGGILRSRVDESESDVAVGVYGRAGIEFGLGENDFMGLGVRALKSELDFGETLGEVEFQGVQPALTYTRKW